MAGEAETKACPWCAETILAAAKKCKHCGEFLEDEQDLQPTPTATPQPVKGGLHKCGTCGQYFATAQDATVHKTNVHGASRASAPSVVAPVWEYSGFLWRCVSHNKAICVDCTRKVKAPSKKGKRGDLFPNDPSSGTLVCPHCQTRGRVTTQDVKVKKGVSGGKATAAVMTAGLSMFATGLSRKEQVTEAHCHQCGSTWHF